MLAHGIGGEDLPIPPWLAIYGAGIAVLVSFAAVGLLWPLPRLSGATAGRPLPVWVQRLADSPTTRGLARALGLVALLFTVATALFGSRGDANPAPSLLYVVLWVGIVPLSLLFGPVWRLVNPLRTLHEVSAILRRVEPSTGAADYPERLGHWPAAIGLAVFVWFELAFELGIEPLAVGLFVVCYALVQLAGATLYGDVWFARADAFEVYSDLVGRMAPFARRPDGELVLRNPLDGLATIEPRPGLVAVVVVLVGSTAFDGVTRGDWWRYLVLGKPGTEATLVRTTGLAVVITVVALGYVAATRLAGRYGDSRDPGSLPALFAPSVVPIAVGYSLAHYFSLLFFDTQVTLALASDPFGTGADLFGTADWGVNYAIAPSGLISVVQVNAIVVGHIVGVVTAHDRALTLFPGKAAVRGQYPLLALMVALTVGGVALMLNG